MLNLFEEIVCVHLAELDEDGDDIIIEDYIKRQHVLRNIVQQYLPTQFIVLTEPIFLEEYEEDEDGDKDY
jgi:hypothetical protein|tara:strand:+ start:3920 stop:4129 length:210 start_codon:yes stop_codon:yes gene_type:complete